MHKIERKVKEVIGFHMHPQRRHEEIDRSSRLCEELNLDSLDINMIEVDLADRFGVEIDIDLSVISTVGQLVDRVAMGSTDA